jgi:hypothetical protein
VTPTGDTLSPADGADALLSLEAFQDYAYLLFTAELTAGLAADLSDYALGIEALPGSHSCLLSGPGGPSKCSLDHNTLVSKFS